MDFNHPTVLLFGDVTDPWVDGIDYVYSQAATRPWLRSFLGDLFSVLKAEIRTMDRTLQDSFRDCSGFQELADRYRYTGDDFGMAHAMLIYAIRAVLLLEAISAEPQLLDPGRPRPELIGVSGGLFSASVVSIATNFTTLYDTCLEAGRVWTRLCNLTLVKSRAMEESPGTWGWAVLGIQAEELDKTLEQFQNSMGVPPAKRARVGVTGDKWSTVIGPPSILELALNECPGLKKLPKNELNIHALQHPLDISEADLDYIVGNSPLLNTPLPPGIGYTAWMMITLARPLSIVQAVSKLDDNLGTSQHVDFKIMGPSSHAAYIVKVLRTAGREVSLHDDISARRTTPESQDGIAIVGMAGKGPGSDDLDEFWDVILKGLDLHQEVPSDRYDLEEYYSPKHPSAGPGKCTMTCKHGCFMNNPGHFDSKFFHISPREALLMDPAHRLFLMNAYEALEMAGYSDGQTKLTDPTKIATFFGQCNDDWHVVGHRTLGCDAYTLQAVQRAFGPGRLAFQFNWEGPTYALDSACAATSSCIHLACMSLMTRDIDMAVAGAANVLSTPHSFTSLSRSGVLSDSGNCKTYRDDADGYCRADFSGAVVLKRLDDAIAHNDNILAVISSSARNHSGNSTSITTSDAAAQERLFRKVLRNARVTPEDISYVEMHGTGTQVGDKAEMGAVSSVFSKRRDGDLLPVGAIKANIGHSEAAAGMSSLLKSILMFQKGTIPPQAGMPHTLNPNFPPLHEINIKIPSEPLEFKAAGGKPRRILLNNFDAAGGNACLLLEEYTHTKERGADVRSAHTIVTSARTQSSHLLNKRRLLKWLRSNSNTRIEDLAYTTTARRMHHPIRFALTASTTNEAISKLESEVERSSDFSSSRHVPVVFAFTGQGSHYAGMGGELYRTNPVFRERVDLCVAICASNSFPPFLDIITEEGIDVSTKSAAQVQLAVLTLEVALTHFWRSVGIEPAMVIGHSLGEYAALHTAGVLSLADALYLVGHRALILQERCESGSCSMLSVSTSVANVRDQISQLQSSSCGVACINSPSATVVSGTAQDLAQFQESITAQDAKVRAKTLSIPFAFHSFQMDPILQDYSSIAGGVTYSEPKIPVASTLLGSVVDEPGVFDQDYLVQQTRQPVNFVGGLNAVKSKLSDPVWLEIGPSPVCVSLVRDTLSPSPSKITHTLQPNTSNWASISKALAAAYTNGVDIDWIALHGPYESNLQLLTLPSYAWDVKNYWITHTDRVTEVAPEHASVTESGPFVSTAHSIGLCSGSVFCEAAFAAAKYALEHSGRKNVVQSWLTLYNPELLLPLTKKLAGADGSLITTAVLDSPSADRISVTFKLASGSASHELGSCIVNFRDPAKTQADWDRVSYFIKARMDEVIKNAKEGSGHRMQPEVFYALFGNSVEFSTDFQGVDEAYIAKDFQEAAAVVTLPHDPAGTRFTFSPYWGEALVHLAGFMVNGNPSKSPQKTFIVMGFESVELTVSLVPGKQYVAYTRISRWVKDTAYCDAVVFDPETSNIILQCTNLRYQELPRVTWKHVLERAHETSSASTHKAPVKETQNNVQVSRQPLATEPVQPQATEAKEDDDDDEEYPPDEGLFDAILDSISKATGSDSSEFTDDTMVADLGVDSIMAIEVVATVKEETGLDLPATFVLDHPTIGDLRRVFGAGKSKTPKSKPISTPSSSRASTPSSSSPEPTSISETASLGSSVVDIEKDDLITPPPERQDNNTKQQGKPPMNVIGTDTSPAPTVRITLLQGRPGPKRTPFYMMADGTGTIATYIHLPAFKSKMPVYGIDSPFLRCPTRLTREVGIEGVAKLIVDALVAAQPKGPMMIGGFSAGAIVAFEVSRQLGRLGRQVSGLVLIDMCCPRSSLLDEEKMNSEDDASFAIFENAVSKDGLWSVGSTTQNHFRAYHVAMHAYHPPYMTEQERPAHTAVIWAEKGMVNRVVGNEKLMQMLADQGIPTTSYPGYMEDPKLGAFACLVPDRTEADLGPNGWEKYTAGEVLALSVKGDHLDLPMPGHVHLLYQQMEKAFAYFQ
ncbi:conidial yellow pigment biosynthesis polyketide synthase [Penicillium mononematosum]|uniref:conidial yellow pigment biosynthesis polyketide synthase n=1 Tax=Penicillium mononematosum TaxID=268346 RepID=UPI0025476781|nr:conidial yellow pigment biosynthesis polyketide synthase [Penicillium mononematosum]KAJ6190544.1 conidial yellow pigment biosynthesis polyketide synthase [Penicillium mononematosum]